MFQPAENLRQKKQRQLTQFGFAPQFLCLKYKNFYYIITDSVVYGNLASLSRRNRDFWGEDRKEDPFG